MRHGPVPGDCCNWWVASVFLIKDKISTAWALNTSAYYYTRTQTDQWFTLHQVLNRVAMIPPSIGFATYLAGNRSRYFVSVARRYTLAGYVVVLAGMAGFTFILGNKNEVFVSLLTGFLCYLASVRRPSLWKVGLTVTAGLWFLYAIDFFRSVPISAMETAITQRIDEATEVGRFLTSSNEAYAAHFSMYGVLANHVEPKFRLQLLFPGMLRYLLIVLAGSARRYLQLLQRKCRFHRGPGVFLAPCDRLVSELRVSRRSPGRDCSWTPTGVLLAGSCQDSRAFGAYCSGCLQWCPRGSLWRACLPWCARVRKHTKA